MIKYKKIIIDHVIYIKVLFNGKVSYLIFSNDNVRNKNNKQRVFPELRIVFEEHFEMKLQEGYAINNLNFRIFQSPFGFSVGQIYHIMELVNEWLPTGNFRNLDTPFRTYSSY